MPRDFLKGAHHSYDVIVIGSGPAGLSAAVYTSRAHLDTLVLTGSALGGQISLTYEVDNYPGFPEDTAGAELAELIGDQSREMNNIIEDLLVAARADIGTLSVKPVTVDIADELRTILALHMPKSSGRLSISVRGDRAEAIIQEHIQMANDLYKDIRK